MLLYRDNRVVPNEITRTVRKNVQTVYDGQHVNVQKVCANRCIVIYTSLSRAVYTSTVFGEQRTHTAKTLIYRMYICCTAAATVSRSLISRLE